jgi:CheY-like chemotaxis protein
VCVPQKSILIVDDDKAILRVLTKLLAKRGFTVTAVETGFAALIQIEKTCFDVALLDVRLPDMLGTDLLPVLRKVSPKTVRIIFTGSPSIEKGDRDHEDMDVFLVKPVSPEVLLNVLNEKLSLNNSSSKTGQHLPEPLV